MSSKNLFWYVVIAISAVAGFFLGPLLFGSLGAEMGLVIGLLIFAGIVGLIIYNLSANKGGGVADGAMRASAETLQPAAGKGRMYITRSGFAGSMQGMNIEIEGIAAGQIKSKQYLMAEVNPGTYRINTQMARGSKKNGAVTNITVAEGQCVGVHTLLEMGALSGSIKLTPIDETAIREKIKGSKLIRWHEG